MNPGDTISRYRIVGRIGRGGMGVVYRAEDTRLRRPVALKFLPDSLDEGRRQRFLNEARSAALARHPNICPIHDIEEADGEIFLVMALIEGETLSRRIARGPVPPSEAAAIAAQVAAGLACAHDLGIVHRDIKSSNIMIDGAGHVSIMDFGLALAPEAMRLTGEGASVGTPDYMSPEQAQGREVDARTDLWSLGVVLFEMLTGRLPFRREHRGALVHAILNDPVPDMPGVDADLRRIVTKALAKAPAERWQNAHTLARALRGEPEPLSEDDLTRTIVTGIHKPSRRRWPIATAAALAVLLAIAGALFYRYRTSGPAIPVQKHIAMLPLSSDTVSPIENGVDDALTAALTSQPNVTLVTSSELRQGGTKTVEAARKYHGVNLALTWSAKPDGDKVEFSIDLTDAVRLKKIDRRKLVYDPKNPIVSRDQAVTTVFRMLKLDAPPVQARAPDTAAPDAYASYLEGRGYLSRFNDAANTDKAIADFENALKQDPNYAMGYAALAEAYWRKGRSTLETKWTDLAVQNAEHAARLDPTLAAAHVVLGSVYRDRDQTEDAILEFQRAFELAPKNPDAARQLAGLYFGLGKFDEAEELYLQSAKARPTDWNGPFLLGNFYSRRRRNAEAVAAYNQAKLLAKDNDLIQYNLGLAYRSLGRYDEAIAEMQQATRIKRSALSYAVLGGVYYYRHQFAQAVSAMETAIEIGPDEYWMWGNLGIYSKWSPENEGKSQAALRKALELATAKAKLDKKDFGIRVSMAGYKARLGDANGAKAELEPIPEKVRPTLAAGIALVYELTGQHDKAVAMVRQNLNKPDSLNQIRDDPDFAAVWKSLR